MMQDASEKRSEDTKTLANKEAALADNKASLEKDTEAKSSATAELGATNQYIQSLHNECDWLYHVRFIWQLFSPEAWLKDSHNQSHSSFCMYSCMHI